MQVVSGIDVPSLVADKRIRLQVARCTLSVQRATI
jgi:hypothetical protein